MDLSAFRRRFLSPPKLPTLRRFSTIGIGVPVKKMGFTKSKFVKILLSSCFVALPVLITLSVIHRTPPPTDRTPWFAKATDFQVAPLRTGHQHRGVGLVKGAGTCSATSALCYINKDVDVLKSGPQKCLNVAQHWPQEVQGIQAITQPAARPSSTGRSPCQLPPAAAAASCKAAAYANNQHQQQLAGRPQTGRGSSRSPGCLPALPVTAQATSQQQQ
ncbi:hypothetical protein TEA_013058 [Camellia sinensis var. sinensis]|uniref:Uncharacterized protein n=1 Tax=Camellia sinensis var. sinensis TaxID=542762 RepID=A0A4S4D5Y7_CAMSN|nr:hypothetical protein TEA_013058 [Camellia sinensis var. sinensis]